MDGGIVFNKPQGFQFGIGARGTTSAPGIQQRAPAPFGGRAGVVSVGGNRFGQGPGGAYPTSLRNTANGVQGGGLGQGPGGGVPMGLRLPSSPSVSAVSPFSEVQPFAFSLPVTAARPAIDIARLAGRSVAPMPGPTFDLSNDKALQQVGRFRAIDIFRPQRGLPQMAPRGPMRCKN